MGKQKEREKEGVTGVTVAYNLKPGGIVREF